MKYKRLIIWSSVILAVIVLCFVLSFTLFTTANISFDFQNQTTIFAGEEKQQEVINSASINTKMPIFTLNKSQIVEKLETRNPYLKVINIETIFPNKLVIHCCEREELFCIKGRDELYYICDDELKILSISRTTASASQGNPIVLEGISVLNTGASVGDILDLYQGEEVLTSISNAFAHNNKNIANIKCMFKSIELKYETNYYLCKVTPTLVLTTYDDFAINLRNADNHLKTKINLMLNIVPQKPQYYKTHELVIDINPENTNDVYCVLEKLDTNS